MPELSVVDVLEPWAPTADDEFDFAKVGHLWRRAGFGASIDVRRAAMTDGVDRAVSQLMQSDRGVDADGYFDEVVALGEFSKLQAFRVWRMLTARGRVRERMSYFWHDHFATSFAKVGDVGAMARHFRVFDEHGLGRFDDLVLAIVRDGAMLRWLDNDRNVKGAPNENLARELFELFTLGRGNYTERDVQEAARAFTGWHVRDGAFRFVGRKHDRGVKEVFGQRGRFDGADIVAMAVERPESAAFVAGKLCGFFVHPEPSAAEIEAVATRYRQLGRDIGATVEAILRSRAFFAARAYRSRIKDPVDLVVGTVRSLGATASPERLARAAATMGQSIGEPPNVAGWPGERAWLNSATWLLRSNFAAELGARYALAPGLDASLDTIDGAVEVLLDGAIGAASRGALEAFGQSPAARGRGREAAIAQAVLDLPEAQLS